MLRWGDVPLQILSLPSLPFPSGILALNINLITLPYLSAPYLTFYPLSMNVASAVMQFPVAHRVTNLQRGPEDLSELPLISKPERSVSAGEKMLWTLPFPNPALKISKNFTTLAA